MARTICTAGARRSVDPNAPLRPRLRPDDAKYKYDVNPRFGASRQASSLNLAPMQLTLDVRFDVGPERERQDLFLRLRTGRERQAATR